MKPGERYFAPGAVPETPENPAEPAPWKTTKVVGTRAPKVDAYERVSGSAIYPLDLRLPDMLYAGILRCPHPHAKVVSIDTSRAESMPGVRAVLTAESAGADMPWYRGREGAASRLFDAHCRHEGEEVAAVAAETPYQVRDALRSIEVTYETLPFVVDEEEALEEGAPEIHGGGNAMGEPRVRERGDLAAGFAAADATVERSFETSCEIHAPMEVHGSIAKWDGPRLTVWDTTQGVFAVQQALAGELGIPLSNVRVIGQYMGGGFGSKLELGKYTVVAALLARKTARPVKLFLSREECFLATGNRPANRIRIKIGARKDGTLTAIDYRSLGTPGAYPAGAGSGTLAGYLYRCENARIEDAAVFTNAGRARPMRAPGFPQGAWALEQAMDELAEKLGLDPVELRLRNVPSELQTGGGLPFTTEGLAACLRRGAEAFGWSSARASSLRSGRVRRGSGMAACFWGYSGGPPSTVIVKVYADGSVNLNMGASDIGTGTKTVMAMVAAEELGVALERIQIEHADTGTTQYATPSGGSKTVPSDSPAVRAAASAAGRQLLAMAASQLERDAADLELRAGGVGVRGEETHVAFRELGELRRQGVVVGTGYRAPNPEGTFTAPFAAHFCEVELDTATGEVRILRFVAAHDSGRVLNRLTYDNQVFGGIVMGVGFGMSEERVLDRATGKMVNANWHDYKIPTMLDVPADMVCVPIDRPDDAFNNTGTKGLGEPATIPTAAAIANAIRDAVGVSLPRAPATPARLLSLLAGQEREG